MEVKIKNTKNKKQRAVVFDFSYILNSGVFFQEPSFFNIKNDDGIEIEYDRDIEDIKSVFIERHIDIKNIEYTSNNTKTSNHFYFSRIDANGKMVFDPVYPVNFITPQQKSVFPIIITDENSSDIKKIDYRTFLLFVLEPNEEIHLKINEKTVISKTAKVNR